MPRLLVSSGAGFRLIGDRRAPPEARCHVVGKAPHVLDAAHNGEAAQVVDRALDLFCRRRRVLVPPSGQEVGELRRGAPGVGGVQIEFEILWPAIPPKPCAWWA
jgi:hypothetical protein